MIYTKRTKTLEELITEAQIRWFEYITNHDHVKHLNLYWEIIANNNNEVSLTLQSFFYHRSYKKRKTPVLHLTTVKCSNAKYAECWIRCRRGINEYLDVYRFVGIHTIGECQYINYSRKE